MARLTEAVIFTWCIALAVLIIIISNLLGSVK